LVLIPGYDAGGGGAAPPPPPFVAAAAAAAAAAGAAAAAAIFVFCVARVVHRPPHRSPAGAVPRGDNSGDAETRAGEALLLRLPRPSTMHGLGKFGSLPRAALDRASAAAAAGGIATSETKDTFPRVIFLANYHCWKELQPGAKCNEKDGKI
jgi:hypothetical protein